MPDSKHHEEVHETAFPPTDFRSFIDAILEANSQSSRLIQHVMFLQPMNDVPNTAQRNFAQYGIKVLEGLMRERRDLDAHYGWVLASDAGSVYKSMGGKSERGATWARLWMMGIFDEYERLGHSLVDAKLELEGIVGTVGIDHGL